MEKQLGPRILYLYCEVMPYNVAALKAAVEMNSDLIIDVFSWGALKKLTTYNPDIIERVNYYSEELYSYEDLLTRFQNFKYDLIYVCNRRESKYLKLALVARKNGVTVIGQSDEQYYGTFRQKIKWLFSRFIYRRYFDYMFVPGYFQYEFMRYLGFQKEQILIGAYTANVQLFDKYFEHSDLYLGETLQLLYVGRLENEKGIIFALEVIKQFNAKNDKKITIKIVGDGNLKYQILNYNFVEIHPFKTQVEILEFLKKTTFFLLPSQYEPWGVVLHEMSAAGIPIICSDQCGARSAFVVNNYNGFVYESNNEEDLYSTLHKACSIDKIRLSEFSERSNQLSKSVTPELWASIIDNFLR